AVRRSQPQRRHAVAALPPHHLPTPQPGFHTSRDPLDHRRLLAVRRAVRDDRRRAAGLDVEPGALPLSAGVPVPAHGVRGRHRAGAGHPHLPRHGRPTSLPRTRGGLLMAAARHQPSQTVQQRLENWPLRFRQLLFYALLALAALTFLLPFLYMASTALKGPREIYSLNLIPQQPTLDNFRAVFTQIPIGKALFNSAFVYGLQTLSVLVFSSIVGYALARLKFFGREFIFNVILLTMMIPGQLLLIPLYVLVVNFGWTDSYQGLIVPGMISAFGIFMFRQNFKTIPQELIDAARVDGSSELTILFRIIWPL